MKHLLLSFFIISLLTSCNDARYQEIQYNVYSSVLDKEFGHFPTNIRYIVGINDTIKDCKDELGTLIYSVQNNEQFFKENCQGDTSFKAFILGIKTIKSGKEIMNFEKLKAKTNIKINLARLLKPETLHHTLYFSKVELNKNRDKAILFVNESSSGSWFFVELTNNIWSVKHKILSWTI